MQTIKNLFWWLRECVCATAVFIVIMAVSFWDTVIMGRSFEEQAGEDLE